MRSLSGSSPSHSSTRRRTLDGWTREPKRREREWVAPLLPLSMVFFVATTWVDVVGYRHEVLHTGVLAELLESEEGPAVAAELVGEDAGAFVGVESVKREGRIHRGAGTADLKATLVRRDGERVPLAVETKVDSNGSREQLERTASRGSAEGVLLALGLTALKMSSTDTAEVSGEERRWHFVGPRNWLAILEKFGRDRPYMPEYAAAVANWTERLDEARQRAAAGGRAENRGGEARELEHLAWLAEVRETLGAEWEPIRTLISGPVMTCLVPRLDGVDVYVQFMGRNDGRRMLCLKCGAGAGPENLQDVATRVGRWASEELQGFQRQPSPRRHCKSATVALLELGGSPVHAARCAEGTRAALRDYVRRARAAQ